MSWATKTEPSSNRKLLLFFIWNAVAKQKLIRQIKKIAMYHNSHYFNKVNACKSTLTMAQQPFIV